MLNLAIKAVSDLGTQYLKNRTLKAEQSHAIEQAKVEAQIKMISKSADTEKDYDLAALHQTQFSWKDEFALLIITLPFIASFVPGLQDYIATGFTYISNTPDWYQMAFMGAIAASLGIRWAFKLGGK
jgi:hypothetical protein|tara:strand:- start:2871 stop:3251 length:381 start_codon:yes stop_codon:yes gene_type:complete